MTQERSLQIILASSSPYRQALLRRLCVEFVAISPDIDENPLENEAPEQLACRLALEKASKVAASHPHALIIGSDQVALLGTSVIGKPASHENAVKQLKRASGQRMTFLTSVCLLNSATGKRQIELVTCTVHFRELDDGMIESYLQKERPYHCAGAFKSEGLGVALMEKMEGNDPTALIGLPLISLYKMLENENIKII